MSVTRVTRLSDHQTSFAETRNLRTTQLLAKNRDLGWVLRQREGLRVRVHRNDHKHRDVCRPGL
jgi:hypothetical protein